MRQVLRGRAVRIKERGQTQVQLDSRGRVQGRQPGVEGREGLRRALGFLSLIRIKNMGDEGCSFFWVWRRVEMMS